MAARPDPERVRKWGQLAGIGPALAAAVLAGYFAGGWLDRKLGTEPWLMVAGVLLGSAAGFFELVRLLQGMGEMGRKRKPRGGGGDGA